MHIGGLVEGVRPAGIIRAIADAGFFTDAGTGATEIGPGAAAKPRWLLVIGRTCGAAAGAVLLYVATAQGCVADGGSWLEPIGRASGAVAGAVCRGVAQVLGCPAWDRRGLKPVGRASGAVAGAVCRGVAQVLGRPAYRRRHFEAIGRASGIGAVTLLGDVTGAGGRPTNIGGRGDDGIAGSVDRRAFENRAGLTIGRIAVTTGGVAANSVCADAAAAFSR